MKNIKCVLFFIVIVLLSQCNKETISPKSNTPEELYSYAKRLFDKKDYLKAKIQFSMLMINNRAGGEIYEKCKFYLAECYYYSKEYITAIQEYESLIKSIPQSTYREKAEYMIAMCYYKLSPHYSLDQEYTYQAIVHFQEFLEDFPGSEFRTDAEMKISQLRHKLAKKEFKKGELYRKMGRYRAAVFVYDWVLNNYYDTKFAEDALYWKSECLKKQLRYKEAMEACKKFLEKYPDSRFANRIRKMLKDINNRLKEESNTG